MQMQQSMKKYADRVRHSDNYIRYNDCAIVISDGNMILVNHQQESENFV